MTMPYRTAYNGGMQKKIKVPVALKIDPDLLDEVRQFQKEQTVPPKQIAVFEMALREFLDRHKEGRRGARR